MTSTPSTLSYQTVAAPLLRHPVLACTGFTLVTLSILYDLNFRLAHLLRLPFFLGLALTFERFTHLLLIAGALFVVHAFRHSPITPRTLRIALIVALWLHAVGYILYSLALADRHWFADIPFAFNLPLFLFCVTLFQDAALTAVLVLWLVLLWRIGVALSSTSFRILSALTLSTRILVTLAWLTLDLSYGLILVHVSPYALIPARVQQIMATSERYADVFSAPLMIALSIWCIFLMRHLSKKAAPLPS